MKKILVFLGLLSLVIGLAAQIRTCYDVQYTTAANGSSPFTGQSVTVQGIVTAARYYTGSSTSNYGFFISDVGGGPWSGLFIFTNQHSPLVGDMVEVTGTIVEYFDLTEMSPVSSFQVISQGNPLPPISTITTSQLASAATGEQWESVFVKVLNSTVISAPNSYQEFTINDGSGVAQVDNQCFAPGHTWSGISAGQVWAEIKGLVDYAFGSYGINPRNDGDMVREYTLASSSIKINSVPNAKLGQIEKVNVLTSRLRPNYGVQTYEMTLSFDASSVKFEGIEFDSTLTLSMPEYTISADERSITISYDAFATGDYQGGPMTSPADDMRLISLLFQPLKYGDTLLRIDEFKYNEIPIQNLTHGTITVKIAKKMAFLDIFSTNSSKNIFNPQLNEKINIRYGYQVLNSGINAKAIVRIYDAQGRLVSTPVNKNMTSANGIETFEWNGRDANLNILPIGLYYCHLEIMERNTGHVERTIQPIVIRSILK